MRKLMLASLALLSGILFYSCSKSEEDEEENLKLTIVIDNKEYVFNNRMVDLRIDNGHMGMSWEGPDGLGSMTWDNTGTGSFQWNDNNTQFMFEPDDVSPRQAFQSYYNDGLDVSTGSVTITQAGEIVSGSIFIEESGRTNTESGNGEYMGESRLTGTFKLRVDH